MQHHGETMKSLLATIEHVARAPPPWLVPHVPALERLVRANATSVAAALNDIRPQSETRIRFVPHEDLPRDEPYESFIHRTGHIPTRDDLHDLFNGLVWLTFPLTKRRLNLLQANEIRRLGTSGPRGALRDALTVFDENGALLQAPPELTDALSRRDWQTVFIHRRSLWQSAHVVLFGHALLEKLRQPRKAITAHVWVVNELSDAAVAESLSPERLNAKQFLPLPVLGVPTWWAPNEQPEFYADAAVFRPLSRRD
jgi:hypothetical protein